MRCNVAFIALALLALVALSQAIYPVTLGAGLLACLESSTPEFEDCVITVENVTLPAGPAIVARHRRISSTWPGGSTIILGSYTLAHVLDVVYGSSKSLSIDGVSITGVSYGSSIIAVTNTELNITNTHVHDFTIYQCFAYGENVTGHWENNRFSNLVANGFPFFLVQDITWTFINQTFNNVKPVGSRGILRFNTWKMNRPGVSVTFGGDITFSNIPSSASLFDTGISLLHDGSNRPIDILSMAGNPSNFIIQNSNISLMTLQANPADSPVTIEIGSIYADSTITGNLESTQRYLFQIDINDTDYVGYTSSSQMANITVLQDVTSHGMGIVSRGYGRSGVPTDVSKNDWLRIEGALTASITGDQSSLFRLTWPVDVYANSIDVTLLPRTGDGLVPSLLTLSDGQFFGSSATLNFESETDFTISSTNSPYVWSPPVPVAEPQVEPITLAPSSAPIAAPLAAPTAPVSAPISAPIAVPIAPVSSPEGVAREYIESRSTSESSGARGSSTSFESLAIPYSSKAPIYLNAINVAVSFKAGGSFEMSNFSLPSASAYSASYQGAAITVLQSSLEISTTSGSIIFANNQNVAGRGGAVYVAFGAPRFAMSAGGTGNIIFNNNIAYYGGALYVEPEGDGTPDFTFVTNGGQIELAHNEAIEGGGAAILARYMIPDLFPASSTVAYENGAAGYGCVFAFDLSASTSDIDTACAPYTAVVTGPNHRIGSNYINAAYCPQYELMCEPVPPSPVPAPVMPPTTTTSPTTTGSPNANAPFIIGCRNTTKVPTGSVCVNGTWQTTAQAFLAYIATGTNSSSGNNTSVTVDAPIFIAGGNVSIPKVTFANVLGKSRSTAMISSNDCITIASVSVDLSTDDIETIEVAKEITTTLISSSCSPSGTTVLAIGAKPKKNCKDTKIETSSTRTTLQATFSVSSSKCNVWWIVLVSVICGVLLLVIIAVVIILLLPEEYRAKLQPFHKTKDAPVTSTARVYSNID